MNVYHALKMIQIEHQPLNHRQVVITDENGKSLSQLTDLLSDCLSKIDLFVDLPSTGLKSIFETDFKRHSEPRLPSTAQINH
ncbi:hypothetical protein [Lacticaseibacillus paracasei]|uniref:hypothetical protein n=1 Tax=Lacticaseibacillus paracasei TaxID=1597 RepID=UPI000E5D3898|nr:hypothetical protein [Lacticaseibacillus paracasei]MCT3370727.1 hypothetical protein [Lacticaseibacillus paracasei]